MANLEPLPPMLPFSPPHDIIWWDYFLRQQDFLQGLAKLADAAIFTGAMTFSGNNLFTGINIFSNAANSFTGIGTGLTALNASNIASGTLADARLSANVTLQANIFNGANQLLQLDGAGAMPAVSGAALTSLNATNISSGTLADARLSSNVPLLNAVNLFTQSIAIQGVGAALFVGLDFTNYIYLYHDSVANEGVLSVDGGDPLSIKFNNVESMSITGAGDVGIVGAVSATRFTATGGAGPSSFAATNTTSAFAVAYNETRRAAGEYITFGANNSATPTAIFNNMGGSTIMSITDAGLVSAANFAGAGSGLTALSASNVSSGTLADARLSSNVPLLNAANLFSSTNQFSATVSIGAFAPSTSTGLFLAKTLASANYATGLSVTPEFAAGSVANAEGMSVAPRSVAGAYTITDVRGLHIQDGWDAGATWTNYYSFYVDAPTVGGTLNRAIYVAGGTSEFVGPVILGSTAAVAGAATFSNTGTPITLSAGGMIQFSRPDGSNQFALGMTVNDLFLRWNFNAGASIMTLDNVGSLVAGSSGAIHGFHSSNTSRIFLYSDTASEFVIEAANTGNTVKYALNFNKYGGVVSFGDKVTVGAAQTIGKFHVTGGRSYFAGNSEVFGVGVAYDVTKMAAGQAVYYGASNSTTPSAIISAAGGSTIFTILDNGSAAMGVATPNASAKMDITSTTQGFLPPRMTTVQRDAIGTPAAGLVVYNTTTGKLNFRAAAAWEAVTSA